MTWDRIVRFLDADGQEFFGEPDDKNVDVGLALAEGKPVSVRVLNAKSVTDADASFTGETKLINKILSPLRGTEIGTIRCIGLNYKDHALEMKLSLPKQPEMFFKPASCLHSPLDTIVLPRNAPDAIDAEVELAIVMKADCKDVSAADALDYVLGYTLANDLTARDVQGKISQWAYAKCFDSFCPVGPVLVSPKMVNDPHNLQLSTTINGKTLQDGTTKNLIFSIPEIIEYLSMGTTLPKGSLILTGTPAGIGASHNPPLFIKEGDDVKLWCSGGIGTLTNPIKLPV